MLHSLKILSCLTFSVVAFLGAAQTTNIPDTVFEPLLIEAGLDNYPLNGSVATANIDTVTMLDLYASLSSMNVIDLTGMQEDSFQMDGGEENQIYFWPTTQGLYIISSVPQNSGAIVRVQANSNRHSQVVCLGEYH